MNDVRDEDEKATLRIAYPEDDAALTSNRDAIFDNWRSLAPIVWADNLLGFGSWVVLSHAGCRCVALEHGSLTRKFAFDPRFARVLTPSDVAFQEAALFFSEEPDHGRIRRLYRGIFSRDMVSALSERVSATCDDLIPTLQQRGDIDVINDLVYPLCRVVNEFIGFPQDEVWRFPVWERERPNARHLVAIPYDPLAAIHHRAMAEQLEYTRRVVSYRRRYPRDDLITKLIRAVDEGCDVTEQELAANAQFLAMATFDTLRDFMSGSILALLQHRGELFELANDPSLMPNAVEELLRFVTPDQLLRRLATDDLCLCDVQIEKGDIVTAVLGAGNRDPIVFTDPHRLWLRRPNASANIAFGLGRFSCMGSLIVKAVMSAALLRLVHILRTWNITSAMWVEQPQIRSLRYFSVVVSPDATHDVH